jgi:hypothetical protein
MTASRLDLRKFADLGVDMTSEPWPVRLRRAQAAKYLEQEHGVMVSPATLAKWHSTRSDGPPVQKFGRIPLYPRVELDAWVVRRLGVLRH